MPELDAILQAGIEFHLLKTKGQPTSEDDVQPDKVSTKDLLLRDLYFTNGTLEDQMTKIKRDKEKNYQEAIEKRCRETERRLAEAELKFTGPKHEVYIKTLTGKKLTVLVDLAAPVEYLRDLITQKEGIPQDQQRLIYKGWQLEDGRALASYQIPPKATLHIVLRLRGGGCLAYTLHKEKFDPHWDYDFTRIAKDTTDFKRGDLSYKRPLGSKRHALKVLGVYSNDSWLGASGNRSHSSDGEWAVAYHGTTDPRAAAIVHSGGLKISECKRFAYGQGIYCTPDPATALAYSQQYTHNGNNYKLVLQSRVDPRRMTIVPKSQHGLNLDDYWVVSEDDAIRPYGICIFPC